MSVALVIKKFKSFFTLHVLSSIDSAHEMPLAQADVLLFPNPALITPDSAISFVFITAELFSNRNGGSLLNYILFVCTSKHSG